VVTKGDAAAERDICRDVLHAFGVQRGLEFRRHEAITFARVDEADEVNDKHAHVESDGDNDQAKDAREKVLEPDSLS